MMINLQPIVMTKDQQERLMAWWRTMEQAQPIVRRLCSLTSELRLQPEAVKVNGMILFV
jgi:hypothetical protein